MTRLTLILSVLAMAGCKSTISTTATGSGSFRTTPKALFAVTGRSPFVASPGETITLTGQNFTHNLKLLALGLGGTALAAEVKDAGTATFKVPAQAPYGPMDLAAEQDGATQKVSVFVDGGKTDHPIVTADASTICAGVQFYDRAGTLQTGTKNCSAASLPDCTADGATGCAATPAFPAVDLSKATPANIVAGITIAGIAGTVAACAPSPAACAADGAVGCVATTTYTAALTTGLAAKVVSSYTVAGIAGTAVAESHTNCAADGAIGCVATSAFTAAATAGLASKILSGQSVAGVSGNATLPAAANVRTVNGTYGAGGTGVTPSLADCAADGGTGCVVNGTTYKAAKLANFAGTNVTSGTTIAGVAGSLGNCAADGSTACVAVATFPAARLANFANSDIRSGVTVAGVVGNLSGAPASCAADAAQGCVTNATYPAALVTGLADKVLNGQTVAGIGGDVTLPPVGNVYGNTYGVAGTGSTGTFTLPAVGQVLSTSGSYGISGSGVAAGTATLPLVGQVLSTSGAYGVSGSGVAAGTATLPPVANVYDSTFGVAGTGSTGSLSLPPVGNVYGNTYGVAGTGSTGTFTLPPVGQVLTTSGAYGVSGSGVAAGTATLPPVGQVLTTSGAYGVAGNGVAAGTATLPPVGNVYGSTYGVAGTGSTGGFTLPAVGQVLTTSGSYGISGSGVAAGTATLPPVGQVLTTSGAYGVAGNGVAAGTATLPPVGNVYASTYGVAGTGSTGSLSLPPVGNVYGSTFGVAGTGSTGGFALPAVGQVLTTSGSYGISGSGVAAGTATLPPVGNVYGNTYGVAGTGSTGTFVLPAVGQVLTTSGSYGISGSGVAAGTATLPPASNVYASTYGIAGTGSTGTYTGGASCTSDGQTGCVTTSILPAAAITGFSTWNLRYGQTLAGVVGTLKTNCRNSVGPHFNYDGTLGGLGTAAVSTGTAFDYWDTVDDYEGFAPSRVSAWPSSTFCDSTTWVDVTTTNGGTSNVACGTGSTCIYKDQISNLRVTGILGTSVSPYNTTNTTTPATFAWNTAIQDCNASTYGGYAAGTWRLPTQKELLSLYEHGIASIVGTNFLTIGNMQSWFWSSSTYSNGTTSATVVSLAYTGSTGALVSSRYGVEPKTGSYYVVCVAP